MSILTTCFLIFKSAAKTLKQYLANHINLNRFAFLPMKIFVSKASSSVKIINFSIGEIDMSKSFNQITIVFIYVQNNKAVAYMSMKRQPLFN